MPHSYDPPLVTVIALCYNHAPYLRECLASVRMQTYPNIELIIIDDSSTDGSAELIRVFVASNPGTTVIFHEHNEGNCRAFNEALRLARGKFVVDLACDDVLLPDRLARQVAELTARGVAYGVCFANEMRIDLAGRELGTFYPTDASGRSRTAVFQGDVYAAVLADSFVPATTMLVRRAVLDELGGYDETLAYEDFDFWVRSARRWQYAYVDAVLMRKRTVPGSLGSRATKVRNDLLPSSLTVCRKARALNRTALENRQLARRVRYFLRQCWYTHHFELATDFANLLQTLDVLGPVDRLILGLCRRRVPIHGAYRAYLTLRARLR